MTPKPSARDWPECTDGEHDYEHKCIGCGERFFGHKGRYSCRLCAKPSAPEVVATAPENIWLQVDTDGEDFDVPFPPIHEEVSWCWEEIGGVEVAYKRADLYEALQKRCTELESWKAEHQAFLIRLSVTLVVDGNCKQDTIEQCVDELTKRCEALEAELASIGVDPPKPNLFGRLHSGQERPSEERDGSWKGPLENSIRLGPQWRTRVTEAMVDAGASTSTTRRARDPFYRARVREILEAGASAAHPGVANRRANEAADDIRRNIHALWIATLYPDWTLLQLPEPGEAFAFNRATGKVYKLPHAACPFVPLAAFNRT